VLVRDGVTAARTEHPHGSDYDVESFFGNPVRIGKLGGKKDRSHKPGQFGECPEGTDLLFESFFRVAVNLVVYLVNAFPVRLTDNECHRLVLTIDLFFYIAGNVHVIKDRKFPRRESERSNTCIGHGSVSYTLDDESRYRRGSCSFSLLLLPILSYVSDVSLKENMNHMLAFGRNHDVNHDLASTGKVDDLIAILLGFASHLSLPILLVLESPISRQFRLCPDTFC
jgi:hypothetical protein